MTLQHSSLGNWVSFIPTVLAEYDLDGQELLQDLGVIADRQSPDSERLAVATTAEAWRRAAIAAGDPAIGIRAAHFVQPGSWHAIGLSAISSKNLREVVELMSRYSAIISEAIEVSLEDCDGQLVMTVIPLAAGLPGNESLDFGLAAGVQVLRSVFPKPLNLNQVMLMRPAPANTRPYEEFFGCAVTFNNDQNRLFFSHADVDLPLSLANPALTAHQERFMIDYISQLQISTFVGRVKKEVLQRLPGGEVSQEVVANAFNMSSRHLQRKLKEEQSSFKTIVEALRKDLALQYIRDEQRPLNDVAYLLGFSDHSNFTRAFKRWYGTSPKAFSQSL